MVALDPVELRLEPYFSFLMSSLKSDGFEVYPLAGDASARRYYRVVHGEESSVLMRWEPFENNKDYPFLSVLNHFQRNDVQVPDVIALDPQGGYILLEDLGDLTLERKYWESQNKDSALGFYRKAIDELIKIHYTATNDKSDCTAFETTFDTSKFLWEMNYAFQHLLQTMLGIKFDEAESGRLQTEFHQNCKRLSEEPRVICHRDYHSRNLMIKLGKMRVIDFQDARMGPIYYDLVSLLRDSYVDLTDDYAQSLIDYYLVNRQEQKAPAISKDEFSELFEIQTVQRSFKACGSFASFFNSRGDKRYLKYLSPTLRKVYLACQRTRSSPFLAKIINDNGLLERDLESEFS